MYKEKITNSIGGNEIKKIKSVYLRKNYTEIKYNNCRQKDQEHKNNKTPEKRLKKCSEDIFKGFKRNISDGLKLVCKYLFIY